MMRVTAMLAWLWLTTFALCAEHTVTMISYNIRYENRGDGPDQWSHRRQSVADVLRSADIVGLQEVLQSQLNDLKGLLPEFEFYGVGRDDGAAAGEMVPIGIRTDRWLVLQRGTFWLSATPEQVGVKGWDAALPRIVSWMNLKDKSSDQRWLVVNTHFDHRGRQARQESGKLIRRWVAEQNYCRQVVVLGDFNARLDDAPLQALIAQSPDAPAALQVARSISAQPDLGPDSTWNGFKAIEPGQRIDHILIQGDIHVRGFQTLDPRTPDNRFASDHLPIKIVVTQAAR